MKVAELSADQAAALDPALLEPGCAIAVRYGDLRAVIGPLLVPKVSWAPLLVGQLWHDNGQPAEAHNEGASVVDIIRTAPATPDGLRGLLDALQTLAEGRTVRQARTAS